MKHGLQIRAHNLEPALRWVEDHRQELQRQPQAKGFEFKLYRLSFLNTLQQQGVICSSCGSFSARHAFMLFTFVLILQSVMKADQAGTVHDKLCSKA